MSYGLKNLQSASRGFSRRERISSASGRPWTDLEGKSAIKSPGTQANRGERAVDKPIGPITRGNDTGRAVGLGDGHGTLLTGQQARNYSDEDKSGVM
jgi:hypothetical protein